MKYMFDDKEWQKSMASVKSHEAWRAYMEACYEWEDYKALHNRSELTTPTALFWYRNALCKTFLESSKQVFEVSPTLVELFQRTDIKNITLGMLHFPYPVLYLHFEEWPWDRLKSGGFFVMSNVDSIIIWGSPHDKGKMADHYSNEIRSISYEVDDWNCDQYPIWENFLEVKSKVSATPDVVAKDFETLSIVIQAILYIQSRNPETTPVEKPRRQKNLEKQAARYQGKKKGDAAERILREQFTAARGVTYVGPKPETKKKKSVEASKTLRRETWVRGHWARYWVGPRDNPRAEMRWKKPHKRSGLPVDPEQARTYRLREPVQEN